MYHPEGVQNSSFSSSLGYMSPEYLKELILNLIKKDREVQNPTSLSSCYHTSAMLLCQRLSVKKSGSHIAHLAIYGNLVPSALIS